MSQGRLYEVLSTGWRARQAAAIGALSDSEKEQLQTMLRTMSPENKQLLRRLLSDPDEANEAKRLLASRPASRVPSPVPPSPGQPSSSGTQGMQMQGRHLQPAPHPPDAKKHKAAEPLVTLGFFGFEGDDPKELRSFLAFLKAVQGQSDMHVNSVFGAGATITGLGDLAAQGGTMPKRRDLMEQHKLGEWFAGKNGSGPEDSTFGLCGYWIQYRIFTGSSFTRSEARDNAVAQAR